MKGHRGKQQIPLDRDTSTLSTANYTHYSGSSEYCQEASTPSDTDRDFSQFPTHQRRLRVLNRDSIRSQQASIPHVANRSTLSPVPDLRPDFDGAAEVSSYVSSVDGTNKGPLGNRHDSPEHRAVRPTRSAVEFATASHFLRANRADNEVAPGAVEFAHATHFLDGPPHGSPADASQRQRTARFIDTVFSTPFSADDQDTVASPTASAIDYALGDQSDFEHLSPSWRGSLAEGQGGDWLPPRESLEYGMFRKGEYSNPRWAPQPPVGARSGNPGKAGELGRRISQRRAKNKDEWWCRGLDQQLKEEWEWSP